jgi:hypothetical protein
MTEEESSTLSSASVTQYEGVIEGYKPPESPKCAKCAKDIKFGAFEIGGKHGLYCKDCFGKMSESGFVITKDREEHVLTPVGKHISEDVAAHWEYTDGALKAAGVSDVDREKFRYFYISSGVHFYGHGIEYANESNLQ